MKHAPERSWDVQSTDWRSSVVDRGWWWKAPLTALALVGALMVSVPILSAETPDDPAGRARSMIEVSPAPSVAPGGQDENVPAPAGPAVVPSATPGTQAAAPVGDVPAGTLATDDPGLAGSAEEVDVAGTGTVRPSPTSTGGIPRPGPSTPSPVPPSVASATQASATPASPAGQAPAAPTSPSQTPGATSATTTPTAPTTGAPTPPGATTAPAVATPSPTTPTTPPTTAPAPTAPPPILIVPTLPVPPVDPVITTPPVTTAPDVTTPPKQRPGKGRDGDD